MKHETIAEVVREIKSKIAVAQEHEAGLIECREVEEWASRLTAIADQGTPVEVWIKTKDPTTTVHSENPTPPVDGVGKIGSAYRVPVHGVPAAKPELDDTPTCFHGRPAGVLCPHCMGMAGDEG